MLILVTNDDGVYSPGLRALANAMATLGEAVIVAPDRNRSAVGHSLTLEHPLRAEEIESGIFAVDGTPTDCVNLGIHGLMMQRPDLVVSGINSGSNMGDDITYSGTVSAAMEASLMGIPAIAVSLDARTFSEEDLVTTTDFMTVLARQVLEEGLPPETFLNVNIPSGPCKGVEVTRQGKRSYGEAVIVKEDPRGRKYYWIGGASVGFEDIPGTDCCAVARGYISVTPLYTNLTSDNFCEDLKNWPLTCQRRES
ncbi:MAG: 5'/3'-nucleotidase SurE [Pelovirga sp.]